MENVKLIRKKLVQIHNSLLGKNSAERRLIIALERLRHRGFDPEGILDIGAHDGNWSRTVRRVFPNAHILMVDALEEKRSPLKKTCNDLKNCQFEIILLGDLEIEKVSFFVVDVRVRPELVTTGSSKFRENNNFPMVERILPQTTLSKIIQAHNEYTYEFLKIDVQGAEVQILKGMGDYLSKVEVIMIEMSLVEYNSGAPLIGELVPILSTMGFVLLDVVEEHRFGPDLFQIDGLFIRPGSQLRRQPPFRD